MTTETLQRIPLAQLHIAPENARFGSKELGDIAALAASIVEVGDLIDPLHVYPADKGEFAVWDGGRRWTALMTLVKGKKAAGLPPALLAGVPCLVAPDKAAAALLSLATFNREQMHPADEFLAYKARFDQGESPERIAAACAVPTPRVRQLLRLCGVADPILDAFRAGDLALDVVEAFTLSTDQARQLAVFEAMGKRDRKDAWHVRSMMREGSVQAHSAVAAFVGREAYEAAGGTFLVDLFDREGEEWADGALAQRLYQEKLAVLVAEVEAEGWAWVKVIEGNARYGGWNTGHDRLRGESADDFTPEQKGEAGAFIVEKYDGGFDVKRGWVKEAKRAALNAAGEPIPPPDPALYGWGHGGHYQLTQVATEATRVALSENPEAAYDGLLTHLAWIVLRTSSAHDQERSSASCLHAERQVRFLSVLGSTDLVSKVDAWRERLDGKREAFCDQVAALTAEEKAQLLAVCFATTLKAEEGRFDGYDRKPERWGHLGWLARRAGVDFIAAWTPDEEFLKKGSKAALTGALAADFSTTYIVDQPKKTLVAKLGEKVATRVANGNGWVPKLLRDLVAEPKAAKPRTARKAAQAPAQAPEAPPAPEGEGNDFPPALQALAGGGKGKRRAIPATADADA